VGQVLSGLSMSQQSNDEERKARVWKALEGYEKKQDRLRRGPTRTNQKPEKEVETACMDWLKAFGFDMNVIESKAVFNPQSGRYISGQVKAGYLDSSGNDSQGHACYVEFKAPGRRSTLSDKQREFALRKIDTNAFAVVVDSADLLNDFYRCWRKIFRQDKFEARQYLKKLLPPEPVRRDAKVDAFFEE